MKSRHAMGGALVGALWVGCIGLAACDGGGSATAARSHSSSDSAAASSRDGGRDYASRDDRAGGTDATSRARAEPAPLFEGKPMWSDNRRHSAVENAQYQFEHHGEELGAKSLDAFLTKTHAFVDNPPSTTLKLVRANGDQLMFDPKSGLFAVARKDGAPRTVFKPQDGMAYWRAQEAQAKGSDGDGSARASRGTSGRDSDS